MVCSCIILSLIKKLQGLSTLHGTIPGLPCFRPWLTLSFCNFQPPPEIRIRFRPKDRRNSQNSVSAERLLIEADMRREKRKQVIDKVSATIILQNYLDMFSK